VSQLRCQRLFLSDWLAPSLAGYWNRIRLTELATEFLSYLFDLTLKVIYLIDSYLMLCLSQTYFFSIQRPRNGNIFRRQLSYEFWPESVERVVSLGSNEMNVERYNSSNRYKWAEFELDEKFKESRFWKTSDELDSFVTEQRYILCIRLDDRRYLRLGCVSPPSVNTKSDRI